MTAQHSIAHITLGALLTAQTAAELGAARGADGGDEVGFSVDFHPFGDIIVTLRDTCDLSTVFSRCREIEGAILDRGTDWITFTRDEAHAARQLADCGRMREAALRLVEFELTDAFRKASAGLDRAHSLDGARPEQDAMTVQRSGRELAVSALLRTQSDELIGPARDCTDNDPRGFRVTHLPNGEVIVTLRETVGLTDVLSGCRSTIQELLEPGTTSVSFTRDEQRAATQLADYATAYALL